MQKKKTKKKKKKKNKNKNKNREQPENRQGNQTESSPVQSPDTNKQYFIQH